MEQNSAESPSLSQLFRDSYLAEARAPQRHSETSLSDSSSSRLLLYGSLKGKAEDTVCRNDPQFPDLSAFLSQEELDKSVNLARQAIGHEPRDERVGVPPPLKSLHNPFAVPSTISSLPVTFSAPTSFPFNPSPAVFAATSTPSFTQQVPDFSGLPATHTSSSEERKMCKSSSRQDGVIRTIRDSGEGYNDLNRPTRNAPYGLETQSKKEFLNKAADFIEELSSLFKANTSKRVRSRVCKAHRSQVQSHNDGIVYGLSPDNKEHAVMSREVERERPIPAVSHQPEVLLDSGTGHVEFQDCRINEEQQYDSVSQEAEEPESSALKDTLFPAEPVSGPPHFTQKLKSREVPEGSKVQLDCIVQGFPAPEVRWFCEGKELENSPDIQIIANDELHSLIITEAFEEDTGRYSCFASNCYGTDSTSAEIYIEGASSSDSDGEQRTERVAQLPWKLTKPVPSCPPLSKCEVKHSIPPQPTAATEELASKLSSLPPEVPEPPPLVTTHPDQELSQASATAHRSQETPVIPVQEFPTVPTGCLKDTSEVLKTISSTPQVKPPAVTIKKR
ncbi:myopalladin-like [Thalassophryne amazonica]|uniref:myopalladin-like n=1 Tax=Thalassophryne amazonica TaxID=390379 RepID=UPI0014716CA1|nr:myopalladin-like [Thalassophryne amazonica]